MNIFSRIRSWVIHTEHSSDDVSLPPILSEGTKVETSMGKGVIIHGSITIEYDNHIKCRIGTPQEKSKAWTHNLDGLKLKVLN